MCAGNEVNKELCDEASVPGPVSCVVPCPNDCVLSPWTSWSTCSQTCSSKTAEGKQTRTRAILAFSAREGNREDILTHPPTRAVLFLEVSKQITVTVLSTSPLPDFVRLACIHLIMQYDLKVLSHISQIASC